MSNVRVGIDMGGTFTDLMAIDADGHITIVKVPSTPEDTTSSFIDGLGALAKAGGFDGSALELLSHGTTVALNAVLQGKWSPIGLLVTEGYRDMIEIARQTVPGDWGAIYSWVKPPRVVPLENVREARGRVSHRGETIRPLEEEDVRAAAEWYRRKGIAAIAICFIHSYASPEHEQRAREIFAEVYPECFVTVSSEILPEFREYERAMTTCLNAVLMPLTSDYLQRLNGRMGEAGYAAPLFMMKSSGGLSRHDKIVEQPIYMAYSGPSAGVLGMAWLAERMGEDKVLTYDMGGTSTDVALVEHGQPVLTTEGMLDIYPMKAPMIDLVSIGAGGGSIATLGTGNRLRVGPESAGAAPGPVCYGRGGEAPTVTDANLVLGRIPPALLGGQMELDAEAARGAIRKLAEPLGLTLAEAAYGVLEIAAFSMAGAVRQVSIKRGRDPRDYALFAYGGAGPLHAAQLASLLGIRRIVIPENPGLGSCVGLLAADIRENGVQTLTVREDEVDFAVLNARYDELERKVAARVAEQGIPESAINVQRSADLRYLGMATEITVPVVARTLDQTALAAVLAAFHDEHHRSYGFSYAGEDLVEIVNLRAAATGPLHSMRIAKEAEAGADAASALIGTRSVWFDGSSPVDECPIYGRSLLRSGNRLAGPAVIDEYDSTVLIPPASEASIDRFGNVLIERR